MPIVLVIIFSIIALALVLLYFLAPPVFQTVVKYSKCVLKGLVFAHIQFFKYMQGKAVTSEKKNGDMESLKRKLAESKERIINLQDQLSEKNQKLESASREIETICSERDDCKAEYDRLYQGHQQLLHIHDELRGRLYVVSPEYVANVWCQEFDGVYDWIKNTEKEALELIRQDSIKECEQFILTYLATCQDVHVKEVQSWALTLKDASSITGSIAAADLDGCGNYEEKLLYLRKRAFLYYYRPIISSMILFLENCRIHSSERWKWEELINRGIAHLSKLGILVNYIPTGTIYESASFENICISESPNPNAQENVIERIISFGINSADLDLPVQNTEIVVNL